MPIQRTALFPDRRPWLLQAIGLASLLFLILHLGRSLASETTVSPHPSEIQIAREAKTAWEQGTPDRALAILDQALEDHPQALALHQLRGDLLATSRHTEEALASYEAALTADPTALGVRWAKWSLLIRSWQTEQALEELQQIAKIDQQNPIIHVRLARELRKVDRLEEAFESYKKAVALAPDMLGWRLALARAKFDLLDYEGADREIQSVLERATPGSPLELSAKNLLTVIYGSTDRGRRFMPVMSPDASEQQLRDWALIRADAWRLYEAGRFKEAEPLYRKMLTLNPMDPLATQHLGTILMQLGRCKEAVPVFRQATKVDPSDEDYAMTVFLAGQCLMKLERWEEAYAQFSVLYDAAVEFERTTKEEDIAPYTRVLDKRKLAEWLAKIRPHVPEFAAAKEKEDAAAPKPVPAPALTETELTAKAMVHLKPQNTLDTGAALMGRDADFNYFRFVIPAKRVIRDDSPTGAHDYIPLDPGLTFTTGQAEIYLVFGLVTASYDEVPLAARCFRETSELTGEQRAVAQDRVIMSTNDNSGYFLLPRPAAGWTTGLYRCALFAGEQPSAYTQVDEVRFRIEEPIRRS
ncbi:MAG: hypothetical protein DCC63_11390 [Nitrospira sp.]|nr:MAG: hypothetical protein DCC63_11390 [Nitrospira sp.]